MKGFIFTDHAQERMISRNITEEMAIETIKKPEKRGEGYKKRLLAFRKYHHGILKVVYKEEGGRKIIISTIWED